MFGICNLSIVSLKLEPHEDSVIVNQVLFGEDFELISSENEWTKIKLSYDNSEGYIRNNQFCTITEENYKASQQEYKFTNQLISICQAKDDIKHLLIGSKLTQFKENTFKLNDKSYILEYKQEFKNEKSELIRVAKLLLNTPYKKGGKSNFGIDHANFIQLVYKLCGYHMPRTAEEQAKKGEMLSFIAESEAGDLAFFDDENGEINHVGIVMEGDYIIHAYGKVRMDKLDQSGIYNIDQQKHTHKLRMIKKII